MPDLPIRIDVAFVVPIFNGTAVAVSKDVPVIAYEPIVKSLVAVPVQLSPHTAVVPLLLNT